MDGFALVISILHGTGQYLTETILHAEDPRVLYVKMSKTDELSVIQTMREVEATLMQWPCWTSRLTFSQNHRHEISTKHGDLIHRRTGSVSLKLLRSRSIMFEWFVILRLLYQVSQCRFIFELARKPWPASCHETGKQEVHATCAWEIWAPLCA